MTDAAATPRRPAGGMLRALEVPAIWAALVAAHLALGIINLTSPTNPFGDVTVVYFGWANDALAGAVPAIDTEWVYPLLALVPMLAAAAIAVPMRAVADPSVADGVVYGAAWLIVVFLATAALVAWLTLARRRAAVTRVRRNAAWWLVAVTVALGPIMTGRIDAITLPIAVAGMLLLCRHPAIAGAVLAAGAWVKVWPAAPFLAGLIGRRHPLRIVVGGGLVTALVVLVAALLGGVPEVASFVAEQTGRGLQVEAPAATVHMLFAALDDPRYVVGYDTEILTVQITGPGTAAVSAATTPLMVVLVVVVAGLGILARRAGASMTRLVPPLALALVLALILTNKVGSPQFVVWIVAVIVAWLVWDPRRALVPALVTVAVAIFTQLIYPWNYDHVMTPTLIGVALLVCRNALYVVLFGLAVARIARARRDARVTRSAAIARS